MVDFDYILILRVLLNHALLAARDTIARMDIDRVLRADNLGRPVR